MSDEEAVQDLESDADEELNEGPGDDVTDEDSVSGLDGLGVGVFPLDPTAPSAMGYPHPGQATAASETSLSHSGHLISAMPYLGRKTN